MRKSRSSEEQIIAILREQEAGAATADVCRRHGVSSATFYKWRAKFGGMDVSDAKRLKALEDETRRRLHSDVDFLGDLRCIVNLDAKVANGALNLRVAEQQLECTHISSSSIVQRGLGPAQRVRAELQWVETDACEPLADQLQVAAHRCCNTVRQ